MTQKFLNLFFKGKWHNYGHFSATMIWAFAAGPVTALVVMTLWELVQWRWDSGWSWSDIAYNCVGVIAYLIVRYIHEFL